MNPHATLPTLLTVACLMAFAPARADSRFSLTTGLDYSTGDYGSAQTTEIWYLPLTARLNQEDWQFKLTLPYLRVSTPAGGVIIGYDDHGTPIYSGGGGPPVTESGLGDLVASATYSLVDRTDLLLDMTAKVKLGTASASKGLGTGETDYGLGFDAYFPLGRNTPFLSLGYKRPGDPAGLELKDTWQAGLGWAYKLSDAWSLGGMFDWRSAATAASEPQRDFMLYGVYKVRPDWKLQGYASQGFSDASPDYSLGVMVTKSY